MGGDSSTTMCLFLTLSTALRSPQTGLAHPVSAETPYGEVVPQLSSHDGRKVTLQEVMEDPPRHLHLSLLINGSPIHMKLQQNRHLTPDFHTLSFYLPDGTRVTEDPPKRASCYYQGRPEGHGGPWSSLSLCSGLRGTLILGAEQRYSIEPALGDPSFKHILQPIGERQNATCGTRDTPTAASTNRRTGRTLLSMGDPREEPASPHMADGGPDGMDEAKYVELVMVADKSEYELHRRDLNALHTRMLEIANRMDAFFRTVGVRVIVVGVEVWSQRDQVVVSSDPAETLSRFLSWREKDLLPRIQHDNAQLLTGVTFRNSSVGMATVGSVCSADRSGGVSMDHSVSILGVASTVAHQLGHNLGLYHRTGDGQCGQPASGKYWIMEQGDKAGYMPGLEFSNCSRWDLVGVFRRGGGKCLHNVPDPSRVYERARCGNLIVERGEQCDCGLVQECADPCCNASSCQLVEGAGCASGGACCEGCQVKPAGSLCRGPLGECDLPEYCTGAAPSCPPDTYLQDGEPCAGGHAYCHQGECRTLHSQCQRLWGPGSSPAPEVCYEKVNVRGDGFGSCGRRSDGTYLPCTPRNAVCGTIQCHGGNGQPPAVSVATSLTVKVKVNGSEVTCRAATFNLGDDVRDPILVQTGTVCAPGKVCVDRRCEDVGVLSATSCRGKCSGHGVCNSNGNCHCRRGWAPPDCAGSGDGGSVDSGPASLQRGGNSVSSTVILVLLLLLVILVLLISGYLKRRALQRRLSAIFSNRAKCQYRATQTSSQLRPQRPPPPHWTQSTELQVMSAADQVKPLPPKRPLPGKPTQPCRDPLLGAPTYPERVIALPSRQAPPPPYTGGAPRA